MVVGYDLVIFGLERYLKDHLRAFTGVVSKAIQIHKKFICGANGVNKCPLRIEYS